MNDQEELTRGLPSLIHKRTVYLCQEAAMSNTVTPNQDAIIVSSTRISCDGGGGALGHPKVWMDMGQDTEVECKYCDQLFRLDPKAAQH